jgi:hypothetical protein
VLLDLYSPECVEGEFCELRRHGVLGSSSFSEVLVIGCLAILGDEAVYRRIQHRLYSARMFDGTRWRTTTSIPLFSGIATTGIGAGGECRRPGLPLALFTPVPGRSIVRTTSPLSDLRALCWSKCEVVLGDARVYLLDLNKLRLCGPHPSFQLLMTLLVVQHLLKVISGVPHVEDYNAIVDRKMGQIVYCLWLSACDYMARLVHNPA